MRRILVVLGIAVFAPGCASDQVTSGDSAAHGARLLRYAIRSRLVGQRLAQVAMLPAHAGRRPPLLVFLHGRGGAREESNVNGSFLSALAQLGRRAPDVVFPSGGDHSYWHDRRGGRWGAFYDATDFAHHAIVARAHRGAYARARLWLDGGDADPFRSGDSALAHRLGIRLHVWPGGHTSTYWQERYGAYLRFYAAALASC